MLKKGIYKLSELPFFENTMYYLQHVEHADSISVINNITNFQDYKINFINRFNDCLIEVDLNNPLEHGMKIVAASREFYEWYENYMDNKGNWVEKNTTT